MGKASRDKGSRREREIVNTLRDAHIPARRVPLSGSMATHKGDVEFFPEHVLNAEDWDEERMWRSFAHETFIAEVKARKKFPGWMMEWLGDNDVLILVEDRREPLVVMTLSKYMESIG